MNGWCVFYSKLVILSAQILSTHDAETSINDVVFVIDTGLVKEVQSWRVEFIMKVEQARG